MMETSAHIKYLFASEDDTQWGVVVTTTGYRSCDPEPLSQPSNRNPQSLFPAERGHRLTTYRLIYVAEGDVLFASTSQRETLLRDGGKFILLFPGEWFDYRPSEKSGWRDYWISFTGREIDERLRAGMLDRQQPIFEVGRNDEIVRLYELALQTAREQKSGFQQVLGGIVNLLLGIANASHRQTELEEMGVTAQLDEAKRIMQENFNNHLPCEEVAERIGMSYSRFRRLFRIYVGFAPAQYQLELKIRHSKELLADTMIPCQEISAQCGFEYPSHFNIAFKKKTGITPNYYRDLAQGREPKRSEPVEQR